MKYCIELCGFVICVIIAVHDGFISFQIVHILKMHLGYLMHKITQIYAIVACLQTKSVFINYLRCMQFLGDKKKKIILNYKRVSNYF